MASNTILQQEVESRHAKSQNYDIPALYTSLPPILSPPDQDTETSEKQDETVDVCLPYLIGGVHPSALYDPENLKEIEQLGPRNAYGVPRLRRKEHAAFLERSLERYPKPYLGYDASRPWLLYWALTGLSLLARDVTQYEDRIIQNLKAAQAPTGGFGAGHGHLPHLATSYALVLSAATVGNAALGVIDRQTMWEWLGQLKKPKGNFMVAAGGEDDVRGAYCAMIIISLLRLPIELPRGAPARQAGLTTFVDGLPEWLSQCQSYEGGLAAAPGLEAHGAFAFCAIACLCLLGRPQSMLNKYFDLPRLFKWLSERQNAPEGGFAGRTNKLVDTCYSHWIGGCWPLLEEALRSIDLPESTPVTSAFDREGLCRWILCCAQQPEGGLRDKPGKRADGYHTCYGLAGLSTAQHRHVCDAMTFSRQQDEISQEQDSGTQNGIFEHAFRWRAISRSAELERPCSAGDVVDTLHPVFVIPYAAVERTRTWSQGQPLIVS